MSSTKNTKKDFTSMFPWMNAMPPMPGASDWFGKKSGDKDEAKERWNEFKSNLGNFWDQMAEMQNSSLEAAREQWNRFFGQLMEMQETFISSLPDEIPSLPGLPPVSVQDFLGKKKEFREMVNTHAMKQADSFFDFCKQGQKQAKSMVSEAVKNAEAKAEKDAEAREEKEAEAKAEKEAKAKAEKDTKAKAVKDTKAKAEKDTKAKPEKVTRARATKKEAKEVKEVKEVKEADVAVEEPADSQK